MKTIFDIIEEYQKTIPVNIEGLIRAMGVKLEPKSDSLNDYSGSIEKIGDDDYLIKANKNEHYYRRRFTMAHELGHYLWHKPMIGDGIFDDKMYRRGNADPSIVKIEQEANGFAAHVLMPEESIRQDNEKMNITDLSKHYQVSESAIKIRLKQLGLSNSK